MNKNYKAKKYSLAFPVSGNDWRQIVASLLLLSAIALLTTCSKNNEKSDLKLIHWPNSCSQKKFITSANGKYKLTQQEGWQSGVL